MLWGHFVSGIASGLPCVRASPGYCVCGRPFCGSAAAPAAGALFVGRLRWFALHGEVARFERSPGLLDADAAAARGFALVTVFYREIDLFAFGAARFFEFCDFHTPHAKTRAGRASGQ